MPTTYPTVDVAKMELTPMIVSVKRVGDLTFTNIGGTLGNVKIKVSYSKSEIKADQFGTTVLDRRVSGFTCTVETEITQIRDMDIVKDIFPHAHKIGADPYKVAFETKVGDSDVDNAVELKLHPQSVASDDESLDWNFKVACPSADSELTFGPTEQTRAKLLWNIYPDHSQTPAVFFTYGDPAAADAP